MTDRINAFLVILEKEMRDDDALPLMDAIGRMRNVIAVTPAPTEAVDVAIARVQAAHDLRVKLYDVIAPQGVFSFMEGEMKLEEFLKEPEARSLLDAPMDISERLQRLEARIYHVNPNCRDSRLCNPHGETGPVTHRVLAEQGKE